MAKRGRKPKPPTLRLVDGSFRSDRHGTKAQAVASVAAAVAAFGKLDKPKGLRGAAARAWDDFIAPATWLDGSCAPAAFAFCALWAEFRQSPANFQSARHAQLRAYMAELGLTDPRNRRPPDTRDDDDDGFA